MKARIPLGLTCIGAAPMRTSTDEISLCGCYIETMFTMEVGTRLGVTLSLDNEVIRCTAVVATKYPQVGNGIDFIDMAQDDRLKLSQYIAERAKMSREITGAIPWLICRYQRAN